MDKATGSHGMDKSWDHPLTTDEIRKKRTEWTLAEDAGLLNHLQQFSDNLILRATKTRENLDSLMTELDETAIFVDNVTNTSLALANTQFIESRVYEDDVEMEKPNEQQQQKMKNKEQVVPELIANVAESIRQGINIMEEKYERLEVIASDSEDEGEPVVPSMILRPRDPYQDRPLPYVIGSEKWKASSKIGLETSSSESEQLDEGESDSDSDNKATELILKPNHRQKSISSRLSSSSSELNDYNAESISTKYTSKEKLHAETQDTFDSDSETISTKNHSLAKSVGNAAPTFAEELAKRLDSVLPTRKPTNVQEAEEPSINQSKDDLFTPEDDEDVFSNKSKNMFSGGKGLFDDEFSTTRWKDKPVNSFKSNIIPSSIDVPPPISSVSTKPKSAIDDLFGDADSEDSDDIFSSKNSGIKVVKNISTVDNESTSHKIVDKKLLSVAGAEDSGNVATSTLETKDLFKDDDDGDLFKTSKKHNAAKPKSVIDDLFGDADSEDSDDIFSSKSSGIKVVKNISTVDNESISHTKVDKRLLSVAKAEDAGMTTSTPETNINTKDLFKDLDDGDLFNTSKKQNDWSKDTGSTVDRYIGASSNEVQEANKTKPVGGVSIFGQVDIRVSDLGSKLSNTLRLRRSSDSSNGDTAENYDDERNNKMNPEGGARNVTVHESFERSSIAAPRSVENSIGNIRNIETSGSSGISIRPNIDNTIGSFLSFDGESLMTSTRLTSEEIYRERVASDSLFARTHSVSANRPLEEQAEAIPNEQDDVFANEDTFEPPPPLSKTGTKSKSKVISLFDDSDSGDDLFSNASSGSRSQKSADLLATTPQSLDKVRLLQKKSLFDNDIDIFGSKDSPDVDIFDVSSKSSMEQKPVETTSRPSTSKIVTDNSASKDLRDGNPEKQNTEKIPWVKAVTKPTSIFDSDDDHEDDLFGATNIGTKTTTRMTFDDTTKKRHRLVSETSSLIVAKEDASVTLENATSDEILPRGDSTMSEMQEVNYNDAKVRIANERSDDSVLVKNASKEEDSLFVDVDDDEDDLFVQEKVTELKSSVEVVSNVRTMAKETLRIETVGGSKNVWNDRVEDSERATESNRDVNIDTLGLGMPRSNVIRVESEREELQEDPSAKSIKMDLAKDTFSSSLKRDPPRTLNVHSSIDESILVPRRTVSGKIKNLMGKMSDLKILSPTSTPPLWRRSEEKMDEDDGAIGKDSEDGGCFSVQGERSSSPSVMSENLPHEEQPRIISSGRGGIEVAVSFDEPAQVETLAATASKSRARIQAKRRPQSRHARQSALRHSGIDFDTVDAASGQYVEASATDDKSELSLSKASTASTNKNTLLSPSTDEEDLFDVPPDLPEDSQKEDTLFGKAPILSPLESPMNIETSSNNRSTKNNVTRPNDFVQSTSLQDDLTEYGTGLTTATKRDFHADAKLQSTEESNKRDIKGKIHAKEDRDVYAYTENMDNVDKIKADILGRFEAEVEPIEDPLRDDRHDPLKDPSQLFAFVTKTPSPEKGKAVSFHEDDSLFSRASARTDDEEVMSISKRQNLDLFDYDGDDLFVESLGKSTKKLSRDTKVSLFDDDEDGTDNNLFETLMKSSSKIERDRSNVVKGGKVSTIDIPKQRDPFESDDTHLFTSQARNLEINSAKVSNETEFPITGNAARSGSSKDIFSDPFVGEDDEADIFGRSISSTLTQAKGIESRVTVKKSVTRDLRKTAEKIVEDPLSVLRKD